MDTLINVFPDIPQPILRLIYEISGASLETASAWLLENGTFNCIFYQFKVVDTAVLDWRDIQTSLQTTNALQQNNGQTNDAPAR